MKTNYKVAIALVAGAAIGGAAIQGLHAQAKPPVYTVTEIDVTNVDAYVKEYVPVVQPIVKKGGGKQLAASLKVTALEGTPPKRVAARAHRLRRSGYGARNRPRPNPAETGYQGTTTSR